MIQECNSDCRFPNYDLFSQKFPASEFLNRIPLHPRYVYVLIIRAEPALFGPIVGENFKQILRLLPETFYYLLHRRNFLNILSIQHAYAILQYVFSSLLHFSLQKLNSKLAGFPQINCLQKLFF